MRRPIALLLFALLMGPVTGSLIASNDVERSSWESVDSEGIQWIQSGQTFEIPEQTSPDWVDDNTPWWERTSLDLDRNGIHDSIESRIGVTGTALVYQTDVTDVHLAALASLGLNVVDVIEAVDGVLLGQVNTTLAPTLAALDDVVMVEEYGNVIF